MKKLFKGISAVMICTLLSQTAMAQKLDGNSYIIDQNGEVSTNFTKNGDWTESEFTGFDNSKVYVTQTAGASAVWNARPSQIGFKEEVYIWKNVIRNGDNDADVVVSTNTEDLNKKIDFSKGYSGWVRVGVVNLPDQFIMSTITASGNGVLPASAIKFIKTDDNEYYADRIFDKTDNLMVLKKDSDTCLHNHEKIGFDDVVPTVVNDRMLVPLRFVSENFGADVKWNGNDKSVEITKNDKIVKFTIGKTDYSVNEETKQLDSAPVIIKDRTMIPLRALSEGLGYEVEYFDGGVVLIGEKIAYDEMQIDKYISSILEFL